MLKIFHRRELPHVALLFTTHHNCVVTFRDRKRTLVPCICRICVSNHIRMWQTQTYPLARMSTHEGVTDGAKLLSQTHRSLVMHHHSHWAKGEEGWDTTIDMRLYSCGLQSYICCCALLF
jgi:hypothetical protein